MTIVINQKGVGLLELLVVIAIIGVMSLIVAPSYVNYKREKAMSFARTQISNNVRMVQSNTLSAVKLSGGVFPYGGYGIHFMESSGTLQTGREYIIFADTIANGIYDVSGNEAVEFVSLPGEVTIANLQFQREGVWHDVTSANHYAVDYISFPPYGNTRFDGSSLVTALRITISNGARSEYIVLSNSGHVN